MGRDEAFWRCSHCRKKNRTKRSVLERYLTKSTKAPRQVKIRCKSCGEPNQLRVTGLDRIAVFTITQASVPIRPPRRRLQRTSAPSARERLVQELLPREMFSKGAKAIKVEIGTTPELKVIITNLDELSG